MRGNALEQIAKEGCDGALRAVFRELVVEAVDQFDELFVLVVHGGDADVVLVHAPEQEEAFVAAGYGTRRYPVMYDDFVIVGPANDPAGIRGMTDAAAAFQKIADAKATFVSRGDESGTDIKEKAIWQTLGITPSDGWYVSAGQGMGEVLTLTEELQAYTLSNVDPGQIPAGLDAQGQGAAGLAGPRCF